MSASTQVIPLSDRVLRDNAGNPLQCQACVTRLATRQGNILRLCDECSAERNRQLALAQLTPHWYDLNVCIARRDGLGQPLTEIARDLEVTVRQVMETLDVDYRCSECDRPADFALGTRAFTADGDRDVPFLGTACCQAFFVNRAGCEYMGDLWEGGGR